MADDDNNRRYPNNLQGLLRFCTESTKVEDAPETRSLQPLSPERAQWLREAIEGMAGADPVKQMLVNVEVLVAVDEDDSSVEAKERALEDLQLHTEDIDLANDFHRIGGLHILGPLLRSEHEGLRWRTADLIATLTQNNPYCQREVMEVNLMPTLLLKLDDVDETEKVRIKSLYALSCLIRDCEPAAEAFVKLDGFSVLLRAMQSNMSRLQTKAAFVLANLCVQQPAYRDTLCDMGMVEQLVSMLHSEHSPFHEHLAMALLNLVTDHKRALQECVRPEFHLHQLLNDRKDFLNDKGEFQEELEHINELDTLCFSSSGKEGAGADR